MKKIGILFGKEDSFPWAFIERVNQKNVDGIEAEAVVINRVTQGEPCGYDVIIDRISQDVPFYRAFLKNAARTGTAVINNPLWWSADDKFLNNSIAIQAGVPVPKTVLLPSKDMPNDTSEESFRNLEYPLDWDGIFEHIGWPAFFKPYSGGGWKHVYKVHDRQEFFNAYYQTGQLVMMLQEAIDYESYFRCYCIGGKYVKIMPYEPANPFHERYLQGEQHYPQDLMDLLHDYVLKLNHALGYEFNTVELAVRDGIPYAIDFGNPAPDADKFSVGEENFEWVVEHAAQYAIERALVHKPGSSNLNWGTYVKTSVENQDRV